MSLSLSEWLVIFMAVLAGLAFENVEDAGMSQAMSQTGCGVECELNGPVQAIIARRLVDHSKYSIGTMATLYPADDERVPGYPFALQEYYASCHQNGSLILLFFPISRHGQNIASSPGHHASISVTSETPAAHSPRVALMGNVTVFFKEDNLDVDSIRRCYLQKHPDAKWWLPGDKNGAHFSYWARFDPHSIYFVGGFGGEHYIGYIPVPLYQAAFDVIERQPDFRILQQNLL